MKRSVSTLLVMLILGSMTVQAQMMTPPNTWQWPGSNWNDNTNSNSNNNNNNNNNNANNFSHENDSQWQRMSQARLIGRLVDYLDLSIEQSEKFFPLWQSYNNSIEKLENENNELVQQIMGSVNNENIKTDDLLKLVNRLEQIGEEKQKMRDDFHKRAHKVIDDRQYVKLVLFPEVVTREFLNWSIPRMPRDQRNNNSD